MLALKTLLACLVNLLEVGVFGANLHFFQLTHLLVLENLAHIVDLLLFLLQIQSFVHHFIFSLRHNISKFLCAFPRLLNLFDTALLFLLEHAHPILQLLYVELNANSNLLRLIQSQVLPLNIKSFH